MLIKAISRMTAHGFQIIEYSFSDDVEDVAGAAKKFE